MDPVGPWSAYASYNRLAGVQAGSSTGELHHHLTTAGAAGAPPTTTAQLLPGGFLSPPPVGYETVFSPLFHHAAAKPHYVSQVTQHRAQALAQVQAVANKQSAEGEYHQTQAFFEQGGGAWQQNSPFGILPHESVVATTTGTGKTVAYENFNAHFAAAQSLNHLNSQIVAAKTAATRAQSPQVTTAAASSKSNAPQSSSATFFQVPTTFANSDSSGAGSKSFSSANSSNLQQSCIVSSPTNTPVTKEYRVPQPPARIFLSSPNPTRPAPAANKQTSSAQIQTKAQTKIYPELANQSDRQRSNDETQSQSSPISFSIMDAPGRLNYSGSNSSAKRTQQFQHNYRHYAQQNANSEQDFQRAKNGADYNNTNGPDCSVVIPRRPSPLQAHSQPSPLGHAASPAYPMYNSPMNSISSPQNSNNQVTPPSPLDVSVPRPNSQTGNVAYPSVITRALNTEKAFPERYERSNQQQQQQQNNQSCWDERQNHSRKFQSNNTYNNSANNVELPTRQIDLVARNEQTQQRVALGSISERQQAYFDSAAGHQVTLQDLSSCRGDPMSIVKNLQQQQSCQVTQNEIKQECKSPGKRRKSSEKAVVPNNDIPGRIPPPAHTSGVNQQQQNGAYFDFDRWNLPPPTSKIFATQAMHQQHQGLMVPHPHGHHPPPPLPYFAPFHLPPHPPDFATSVDMNPMGYGGDQSAQQALQFQQHQQTQQHHQQEEDQPKVVVPNIEEELNFLSQDTVRSAPTRSSMPKSKSDKPAGAGSGFMSSYLKFLQGERDNSPPPAARGSRKHTWTKLKPQNPEEKSSDSNGMAPAVTTPQPAPITRLSKGDPQDDPRYFPLPKERKRNSFDSSDDGVSSDEDFFKHKRHSLSSMRDGKDRSGKKGRPPKPGGPSERKRARKSESSKGSEKDSKEDSFENVPRRETSKRAAKEKNNFQQLVKGEDEPEEPPEYQDSDSDPAWTPQSKEDIEEAVIAGKHKKRGRPPGSRNRTRNLITAAAQGAGIQDADGYNSDLTNTKKLKGQKSKQGGGPPTLEDNIAASLQNNVPSINDDNPFKPGEFVVIKSDLNQEWPCIWRVDGKTLLQKYEPFEQNGVTLYRNISTYTSWTPESKKLYISVPVRYKSQGQLETVVEFLRNEMTIIDVEYQEKCMKNCEVYQDNFEVYIQTLISQALDSNFLTEIFQEKDEYFLSNVKIIDEITEGKKKKLLQLLKWPPPVQAAVCTWPCFNVIREVNLADAQSKNCAACGEMEVSVRVLMYGQPYNSTTLEGCQPDPKAMNEKNFLMCRICANRVELSNKVTHQKYLMYIECAKRVGEKRTSDPSKDTTCILNELLADENWLNQLFLEVRTSWAEIDCIEHSFKMKTI